MVCVGVVAVHLKDVEVARTLMRELRDRHNTNDGSGCIMPAVCGVAHCDAVSWRIERLLFVHRLTPPDECMGFPGMLHRMPDRMLHHCGVCPTVLYKSVRYETPSSALVIPMQTV